MNTFIEPLEARIAPAAIIDVIVKNGNLTIKTLPQGDGDVFIGISQSGLPGSFAFIVTPGAGAQLRFEGQLLGDGVGHVVTGVTGAVTVSLGAGADSVTVSGTVFPGALTINLGAGDNIFNATGTVAGAFTYKGGPDSDTVSLLNARLAGAVTVDLGAGTNSLSISGLVTSGNLTVKGGAGGDTLSSQNNEMVRIGGKFTALLGDGANVINLMAPLYVAKDVAFTGGKDADNLKFSGGSDYIVGGSVTMSSKGGNDQLGANTGGVLQVGKNFTLSSLGGASNTVLQDVLVSLGIHVGGKVSLTSGLAETVTQSFHSSFRDTAVDGGVSFKATGETVNQTLSAGRVLTVGSVAMAIKGVGIGGTLLQIFTAAIENTISGSAVRGAVNLTGSSGVVVALPGDIVGALKVTTATDRAAAVFIGDSFAGYSGRIHGAVTVKTGANAANAITIQNILFSGALKVTTAAGADSFTLRDVTTAGAVVLDGKAGADTFNVETGSVHPTSSLIFGPFKILGAAGNDTVFLSGESSNQRLFVLGSMIVDFGTGFYSLGKGTFLETFRPIIFRGEGVPPFL